MNVLAMLMQSDSGEIPSAAAGGAIGAIMIVYFAVIILMVAAMWKIFAKAGKPGWAAIVPIYNLVVLLEIVQKPLWWIVLFLVPLVNLIAAIMVVFELAKKFGKGAGFALGMLLLAPIFYPVLAFGDAQYNPNA